MAQVDYSPKKSFQDDKEAREEWAKIAVQPVTHKAIIHAQAQMAFAGFRPAEMTGVTYFIVYLLNMSDDIKKIDLDKMQQMRDAAKLESFGVKTPPEDIPDN